MLLVARMIEERCHRDDDDRPLREGRTPATCLRADDLEYRPCPYPGTRRGEPMNVAALRQMSAHWDEVLTTITWLRVRYREVRGLGDARLDVLDLWRISQLAAALPWWFILGEGGRCPAYAAALAKAAQGVGVWAQRVFVQALAERVAPPTLTTATIVELAERNGTLIADAEVCGASDKMLGRFFDAMSEEPLTGVPSPTLTRTPDAVVAFGASYLNFKLGLWIHFLARRFVFADLIAALGDVRHGPVDDVLTGLEQQLAAGAEPGDFFVVGPTDLAGTPSAMRVTWLTMLAVAAIPCAPAAADQAVVALVGAIAEAAAANPVDAALIAEVIATTGCTPEAAARAAGALDTYVQLDRQLGELIAAVEQGVRTAAGLPAATDPIDAAVRDLMVATSARAALVSLAPTELSRRCVR